MPETNFMAALDAIVQQALAQIGSARDLARLQQVRVNYLGRKGLLNQQLRHIGELPPAERPAAGERANAAKQHLENAIQEQQRRLEKESAENSSGVDVTLPGRRPWLGQRHPLTVVMDEIKSIFRALGFAVVEGPEMETEYYNFEALNIPADHPARDTQDTFLIDETHHIVLRTHTSPMQIRVMEQQGPPVRVIAPGRCYRNEKLDATHAAVFHQVEGLYVDQGVTMADLKGALSQFAREMFGSDVKVRFRPDFFPFTEPSVDYAFTCVHCSGKGCGVCKNSGWVEVSGAGMVDPEVFRYVGYDPERYTGFAFGMGIERIAMLKYGIDDIRRFLENDLRFIHQFF